MLALWSATCPYVDSVFGANGCSCRCAPSGDSTAAPPGSTRPSSIADVSSHDARTAAISALSQRRAPSLIVSSTRDSCFAPLSSPVTRSYWRPSSRDRRCVASRSRRVRCSFCASLTSSSLRDPTAPVWGCLASRYTFTFCGSTAVSAVAVVSPSPSTTSMPRAMQAFFSAM